MTVMVPEPDTARHGHGQVDRRIRVRRCIVAAGCVLGLYSTVAALKVRVEHRTPHGFHKEEFALQYRYARLIASGNQVPQHDRKLQYPEGVRPCAALPLLAEHVAGYACRCVRVLNPTAQFDYVLVWVKALWSTLSVVACAALAALLFREGLPAIACAVLYGLAPASMYRSVIGLAHEDFALPLLFGGLAGLLASLRGKTAPARFVGAVLAGLLWTMALLTWHFARFFLTAQASVLLVLVIVASNSTRRRLMSAMLVVIAILAGGGVLFQHLRSTQLLTSLPIWLLACVPGTASALVYGESRAPPLSRAQRSGLAGLAAGAILGAWALVRLLFDAGSLYGHVWELLWARLTHWSGKPDDPSALSFDARVLWTGSFHAPELLVFVSAMWAPLLAAAIVLVGWRRIGRRVPGSDARDALVLLLLEAAVFVTLALCIARLSLLAVFFLSVLGAGLVTLCTGWQRRLAGVAVAGVMLLLACSYPSAGRGSWLRLPVPSVTRTAVDRFQPISQVDHSLLAWIALETPADAVFVGRFNVLPPVLAYADRAIVLHSKFEVPGVRRKVEAHFRAVFGSEVELAAFCDQQGAGYYLHDPLTILGTGPDSARYLAGLQRVPQDCAAYALQFAPERLRRFELVYQNGLYRVYRRTEQPTAFDPARFPYQPIYDSARFGTGPTSQFLSDDSTEAVLDMLQQGYEHLRRAVALFAAGRRTEAFPAYQQALAINPSLPYAHSHSARILQEWGRLPEALREADQAVRVDAFEPEGWFHRAMIQAALGDRAGARQSLQTCGRLDPAFPNLRQALDAVIAE